MTGYVRVKFSILDHPKKKPEKSQKETKICRKREDHSGVEIRLLQRKL
jgi:hypothetical protein